MLETGARAPDFRLVDLDGAPHDLNDLLSSGPVLLAFFKTTCPTCQFTFPFLERLHPALRLFAVSQDNADDTREFNREFGVTFPALLDRAEEGYPASNAFGISHVPSLFLIERDGVIGWTSEGFVKKDLAALAQRAGVRPFKRGEHVPEMQPG